MPKALVDGAHAILYSRDADRDRAFLRDILAFPSVDVGHGWLIFALPPSEIAVHPSDGNGRHELYLMTSNIAAFTKAMAAHGIECAAPQSMGWGVLTSLTLPGGGTLGVYEPRHARPAQPKMRRRKTSLRAEQSPAKRSAASSRRAVSAKGARRRQ
jgi:hypothetical protein